jgi:hypothetical protein
MPRRLPVRVALTAAAAGLVIGLAHAQSRHSDGFDGKEPQWQRGPANVPYTEEAHVITDTNVHSFPSAEYVRLNADATGQLNPSIRYEYPTPPAPVTDDLTLGVWVRSNRPGVQLLARLVLPKERNPDNLNEPLTTILRGEVSTGGGGFWQPLKLRNERRNPVRLLKDEQQMLRARLQRDVNIADAYIDRVILNLYTGPGVTEVWIDDLEIGPILEPKKDRGPAGQTTALSKSTAPPGATVPGAVSPVRPVPGPASRAAAVPVEFNRGQFRVDRKPFFFRGVRYTDTPPHALKMAGLNTLFVEKADPALCDEAAREGLWLVPVLPATGDAAAVTQAVSRFPADDAVLFWHLGDDRTAAQIDPLTRAVQAVRAADPQRPLAADVWDGVWGYSVNIDLMSAHRFPLMTSLSLTGYRDWLVQRKALSRSPFFWTWVQTHLPDWYLATVLPESTGGGFSEPVGPQAEQIRVLTYVALAAGCKGLGFWSDRFLANSHQGRDRLLTLALLNQEIQMLEPLLFGVVAGPSLNDWIDTSVPEVKAAVLRCDRGVLVLPLWLGQGAQFVPGQSAANRVTMVVPQVPNASEPWLMSPGDVRKLEYTRVSGGTQITLTEFDQTAAVVFTADTSPTGLIVRSQELSRRMVKLAAQYSYDLAREEIAKVEKVEADLAQLAPITEAASLLPQARRLLKEAEEKWNAEDYRGAYKAAQRALRPVRILMRAHWEQAAKSLGPDAPPTASPYATSYFTLPKHWQFRHELELCSPGGSQLPDGDFERSGTIPAGWQAARATPDDVVGEVRVADNDPHAGRHSLMIRVRPKPVAGPNPPPPPQALEPTFVGVVSPPVKFPPGSLVRVSGWVKVPAPITASPDGALLFDSAGGEPLGVRVTEPTREEKKVIWKRFILYRRVPASGLVQVTAALTGIGTVYFDDLKIEALNSAAK